VIVVTLVGALHTERIPVPVNGPEALAPVYPLVCALDMVEDHQITLLRLLPPETQQSDLVECEQDLGTWPLCQRISGQVTYRAVAAESRLHQIVEAAEDHDITVMATSPQRELRRGFFGSLAEDVAQRSSHPILLVCGISTATCPGEST
jgi:hypothetical protein